MNKSTTNNGSNNVRRTINSSTVDSSTHGCTDSSTTIIVALSYEW